MDTHRDHLEKIAIRVNGVERFATGLSKSTTIDEIKYAMLSVSEPDLRPEQIAVYGLFEKWHGHERLIEGKTKIYKVVNFWKSLPGEQLSQVKFIIKKKKLVLSERESLPVTESAEQTDNLRCSLIDLVSKQNEFLAGQLNCLSSEEERLKCEDVRERILEAIELELAQSEKIDWLGDSLAHIGELIEMKKEFISRIEEELEDKDERTEIRILYEPKEQVVDGGGERPLISVMSTTTSSIFTSVSSTSTSENYVVAKDSAFSPATDAAIALETLV